MSAIAPESCPSWAGIRNYRSAIYTRSGAHLAVAQKTRDNYQATLKQHGRGTITTEIEPLKMYFRAEEYHQDYLEKNPRRYCGLGGTGVVYPRANSAGPADSPAAAGLDTATLDHRRQLIVFEAADCAYCRQFKAEVLDRWQADVAAEHRAARWLGPGKGTVRHPDHCAFREWWGGVALHWLRR